MAQVDCQKPLALAGTVRGKGTVCANTTSRVPTAWQAGNGGVGGGGDSQVLLIPATEEIKLETNY